MDPTLPLPLACYGPLTTLAALEVSLLVELERRRRRSCLRAVLKNALPKPHNPGVRLVDTYGEFEETLWAALPPLRAARDGGVLRNLFLAGGATSGCVMHRENRKGFNTSDLDFYVCGVGKAEAQATLCRVYDFLITLTAEEHRAVVSSVQRTRNSVTIIVETYDEQLRVEGVVEVKPPAFDFRIPVIIQLVVDAIP